MAWSNLRIDGLLELTVMLFQFIGVGTLCVTRLIPETRWADRGRVGFVFAMVGLGVFGALCGRFDSEFALFAGGTMTVLLIGMIAGSGSTHATTPRSIRIVAEPEAVAWNFRPPELITKSRLTNSGPSGPDFFSPVDLTGSRSWVRVPSVRKSRTEPATIHPIARPHPPVPSSPHPGDSPISSSPHTDPGR